MPNQAIHPASDFGIRMRHAFDKAERDQFFQASPYFAAVEFDGLGDGRQSEPEISAPAGMGGHEPIDTLFLTAAIRVLEDGNRHEPNPLPGIVFHAVVPFRSSAIEPDHRSSMKKSSLAACPSGTEACHDLPLPDRVPSAYRRQTM
jgi:hypothetical protein